MTRGDAVFIVATCVLFGILVTAAIMTMAIELILIFR